MSRRSGIDKVIYGAADESTESLFTGALGLMGTWEVAQYLGVEKSRIARWLSEIDAGKDSIEQPVARLKSGPFWTLEQVQRKAAQMYEAEQRTRANTAAVERWLKARRARRARPRDAAAAAA